MDLRNPGNEDLAIRPYLENPMGAPPTDEAISGAVQLQVGGGWTHVSFAVDAVPPTNLAGDTGALLSNVTALRIVHAPNAEYPPASVTGQLGVDDIMAVPEPPGVAFATLGVLGALWRRRKRLSA